MTAPHARAGFGFADTLVGTALGLAVVALLVAGFATGTRLLAAGGRRGEAEDTAQLAVEAFTFDLRRAGFDPRAIGVEALAEARADRLIVAADLDGDGAVDAGSEERVTWVCNLGANRLSRIVGAQSLPLADDVEGCALAYRDADGADLAVPPAGLDAATRARVASVELGVALRPAPAPRRATRTVTVALRGRP